MAKKDRAERVNDDQPGFSGFYVIRVTHIIKQLLDIPSPTARLIDESKFSRFEMSVQVCRCVNGGGGVGVALSSSVAQSSFCGSNQLTGLDQQSSNMFFCDCSVSILTKYSCQLTLL